MSGWAAAVCSKRAIMRARIGVPRDRDRELDIALPVRKRPIGQALRYQFSVGHHDFGAVERADDAGANPDVFYQPRGIVDLNHVSDVDGPLKKQNQPRYKIVKDVLESESNSDAECTGENRDSCHIHP